MVDIRAEIINTKAPKKEGEEKALQNWLTLDIETTGLKRQTDMITAIVMKISSNSDVIFLSYDGKATLEKEKQLLEVFLQKFQEILNSVELVVTYNGHRFDWPFILARLEKHGLDFTEWNVEIKDNERIKKTVLNNIHFVKPGKDVIHVDLFYLVKAHPIANSLPNFKLKTVGSYLGLMDITEREMIDGKYIDKVRESDFERFKRYAIDDVVETEKLAEWLFSIEQGLAELMNKPFCSILQSSPTTLIQSLIFREYRRQGLQIPTPSKKEIREFTGAYTDLHYKGFAKNIVKFDYASLYPSIMIAYNIHPENDKHGIFIKLLKDLYDERIKLKTKMKRETDLVKKKKMDVRQQAIKVLINSFYGYLGYPRSYFYDVDMAEKVTLTGQKLIKTVITEAKKRGFIPLETDTDGSYFVYTKREDVEEFVEELNNTFKAPIRVEIDGYWEAGIFIKKKTYALIEKDGSILVHGSALKGKKYAMVVQNLRDVALKHVLNGSSLPKVLREVMKEWEEIKKKKNPEMWEMSVTPKDDSQYKTNTPNVELVREWKEFYNTNETPEIVGYYYSKKAKQRIIEKFDYKDLALQRYEKDIIRILDSIVSSCYYANGKPIRIKTLSGEILNGNVELSGQFVESQDNNDNLVNEVNKINKINKISTDNVNQKAQPIKVKIPDDDQQKQINLFLEHIASEIVKHGWLEIRPFDGTTGKTLTIYRVSVNELDAVREYLGKLKRYAQTHPVHIYFGVAPRNQPLKYENGKSNYRGKNYVDKLIFLWGEFDPKDGEVLDLNVVMEWIKEMGIPEPTYLINSGHGFHFYYKLSKPADSNIIEKWKDIWKVLIGVWTKEYKAKNDLAVFEKSRIMRIPGFYNVKRKPFKLVKFESIKPENTYNANELIETLEKIAKEHESEAKTTTVYNSPIEFNNYIHSVKPLNVSDLTDDDIINILTDAFKPEFLRRGKHQLVMAITDYVWYKLGIQNPERLKKIVHTVANECYKYYNNNLLDKGKRVDLEERIQNTEDILNDFLESIPNPGYKSNFGDGADEFFTNLNREFRKRKYKKNLTDDQLTDLVKLLVDRNAKINAYDIVVTFPIDLWTKIIVWSSRHTQKNRVLWAIDRVCEWVKENPEKVKEIEWDNEFCDKWKEVKDLLEKGELEWDELVESVKLLVDDLLVSKHTGIGRPLKTRRDVVSTELNGVIRKLKKRILKILDIPHIIDVHLGYVIDWVFGDTVYMKSAGGQSRKKFSFKDPIAKIDVLYNDNKQLFVSIKYMNGERIIGTASGIANIVKNRGGVLPQNGSDILVNILADYVERHFGRSKLKVVEQGITQVVDLTKIRFNDPRKSHLMVKSQFLKERWEQMKTVLEKGNNENGKELLKRFILEDNWGSKERRILLTSIMFSFPLYHSLLESGVLELKPQVMLYSKDRGTGKSSTISFLNEVVWGDVQQKAKLMGEVVNSNSRVGEFFSGLDLPIILDDQDASDEKEKRKLDEIIKQLATGNIQFMRGKKTMWETGEIERRILRAGFVYTTNNSELFNNVSERVIVIPVYDNPTPEDSEKFKELRLEGRRIPACVGIDFYSNVIFSDSEVLDAHEIYKEFKEWKQKNKDLLDISTLDTRKHTMYMFLLWMTLKISEYLGINIADLSALTNEILQWEMFVGNVDKDVFNDILNEIYSKDRRTSWVTFGQYNNRTVAVINKRKFKKETKFNIDHFITMLKANGIEHMIANKYSKYWKMEYNPSEREWVTTGIRGSFKEGTLVIFIDDLDKSEEKESENSIKESINNNTIPVSEP